MKVDGIRPSGCLRKTWQDGVKEFMKRFVARGCFHYPSSRVELTARELG